MDMGWDDWDDWDGWDGAAFLIVSASGGCGNGKVKISGFNSFLSSGGKLILATSGHMGHLSQLHIESGWKVTRQHYDIPGNFGCVAKCLVRLLSSLRIYWAVGNVLGAYYRVLFVLEKITRSYPDSC